MKNKGRDNFRVCSTGTIPESEYSGGIDVNRLLSIMKTMSRKGEYAFFLEGYDTGRRGVLYDRISS